MVASGKEFLARKDLPLDDVKEKNRLFKKTNEEQDILNPQTKWKKKGVFPKKVAIECGRKSFCSIISASLQDELSFTPRNIAVCAGISVQLKFVRKWLIESAHGDLGIYAFPFALSEQ